MVRVGQIETRYFDTPTFVVYEFVLDLAADGSPDYVGGEGSLWGNFTLSQMRMVAQRLVKVKGYTNKERAEIDAWVDSLPWDDEWDGEKYINLYFDT